MQIVWTYRRLCVSLMMLVVVGLSIAQDVQVSIPYTRYTVANGLAQMQIRSLFIDQDGYVWIGTQGGLSGFDGSRLRTYQDLGAVSEGEIFTLIKGADRLYGSTLNTVFEFDGVSCRKLTERVLPKCQVLFEDKQHTLWLQSGIDFYGWSRDTLYRIEDLYPQLRLGKLKRVWGDPSWEFSCFLDTQNRFYIFKASTGSMSVDSITFTSVDSIAYTANRSAFQANVILYKVKEKITDIYRLKGETLELVASDEGKKDGVRQLSDWAPFCYLDWRDQVSTLYVLQDSIYRPNLLPLFNHTRFVVEHGSKAYVATDEGFIVAHGDGLENVAFPQCDYPWSVVSSGNDIMIGCYKSGVFALNTKGKLLRHYPFQSPSLQDSYDDQILSNSFSHQSIVFFGGMKGFYYLRENDHMLNHFEYPWPVEAFAYDSVKHALVIGSDKLYWIDASLSTKGDSFAIDPRILSGAWVKDLLITKDMQLWVAGGGGVQRINMLMGSSTVYLKENDEFPCYGAISFVEDMKKGIWVGATCGLLRFADDHFEAVLPDVLQNRINQLTILLDQRLACVSKNDLFLLNIAGPSPEIIAVYSEKNGLRLYEPSENGISMSQDQYMWLPSVAGIQRLNLQAIDDAYEYSTLRIMGVNNLPIRLSEDAWESIRITGSSALLDLSVIDHTGRNWKYQFSLNGSEFSQWLSSNEVLITGLNHGQNKAIIRSSWNPSDPGTFLETDVMLKAELPLMQRTSTRWILIALVVILLLVVILAILRAQGIRRRMYQLRSDLYQNRLRTIQAYLNPHFLFNTLTSIQDRILQRDTESGNDMIVRLSRVFRKVLDAGRFQDESTPMIRLSEEIALVEDMVYLYMRQTSIPVAFELEIDSRLKALDPLIPPLLIQPFVENAFKHAFSESSSDRHLAVRVKDESGFLAIIITDNGAGFTQAQSHESTSMGIHLARERMRILKALGIESSLDIREESPHGTKVEIKIKLRA